MMQDIIQPISIEILKSELTPEKKLRTTNKSNNEIYVITAQNSPNVMLEIGRLRELAFRHYGGGTGNEVDIDEFDTMDNAYRQLIVWSPEDEKILGGYRFLCGADVKFDEDGKPILATSHLFNFSDKFVKEILPYTVELGRSFVTLEYQATNADVSSKKAVFVLDNLWDGLGALSVVSPTLQYYFGKVTMYDTYETEARDMILYFLDLYFGDREELVTPIYPLKTTTCKNKLSEMFSKNDYKEDYKELNIAVRQKGINVPPLISAYMNLTPNMKAFGTAVNEEFGNVEETGILIKIDDILEDKKKRHIESFLEEEYKPTSLVQG